MSNTAVEVDHTPKHENVPGLRNRPGKVLCFEVAPSKFYSNRGKQKSCLQPPSPRPEYQRDGYKYIGCGDSHLGKIFSPRCGIKSNVTLKTSVEHAFDGPDYILFRERKRAQFSTLTPAQAAELDGVSVEEYLQWSSDLRTHLSPHGQSDIWARAHSGNVFRDKSEQIDMQVAIRVSASFAPAEMFRRRWTEAGNQYVLLDALKYAVIHQRPDNIKTLLDWMALHYGRCAANRASLQPTGDSVFDLLHIISSTKIFFPNFKCSIKMWFSSNQVCRSISIF